MNYSHFSKAALIRELKARDVKEGKIAQRIRDVHANLQEHFNKADRKDALINFADSVADVNRAFAKMLDTATAEMDMDYLNGLDDEK